MSPPVAPSDLLPADVYALVRPDYRARILQSKDRRRVLIGPHISLLFESRETVLYQIQEVLWAERTDRPTRIAEEIAEYERLVPRPDELTATLMIHGGAPEAGQTLVESLVSHGRALFLDIDGRTLLAEAISPLWDTACPVQYVRFPLDRDTSAALLAGAARVHVGVAHAGAIEIAALPRATVDEIAAHLNPGAACVASRSPLLQSPSITS